MAGPFYSEGAVSSGREPPGAPTPLDKRLVMTTLSLEFVMIVSLFTTGT
jgi:hypothetical protein